MNFIKNNILRRAFSVFLMGFLVMASVSLTGCESQPEDLIDEDTYIDLLVEFELINSLHSESGDTDTVLRATDEVFRTYEITEEQFLRSHEFYQTDVENQVLRHRTAVERVSKVHGELNNRFNEQQRAED